MFTVLLQAGGNVNNPGNDKCGKYPIDHAIQHQRLDSVQVSEMSVRVGMRDQWRIYIVNFERAPARSNFLHFIQFSGNFGRTIGYLPEILDPPMVLTQNAKSIQWRIQDFPRGGANSQSGCANLFFWPKTA